MQHTICVRLAQYHCDYLITVSIVRQTFILLLHIKGKQNKEMITMKRADVIHNQQDKLATHRLNLIQLLVIMEAALLSLSSTEKATEEMAKLVFHSQPHPSYTIRTATEKDLKWIEEKKYTVQEVGREVVKVEKRSGPFQRSLKISNVSQQCTAFRNSIPW